MPTQQRLEAATRTAPRSMTTRRQPEQQARGLSPDRDPIGRSADPQDRARPPDPQDRARPPDPQDRARPPDPKDRARPLVLLAEDDQHDGEIYGKTLWYNGYDVLHAADGEAALDLARRHTPDLIIVDLLLPKMNGIELCRRLREEPGFEDVPTIALTARAEREFGLLARDAGCTDYLEKPIGPFAVLAAVEKAIGRAPSPGEDLPDEAPATGDPSPDRS
jgi:CheY-like chemotaxis protein